MTIWPSFVGICRCFTVPFLTTHDTTTVCVVSFGVSEVNMNITEHCDLYQFLAGASLSLLIEPIYKVVALCHRWLGAYHIEDPSIQIDCFPFVLVTDWDDKCAKVMLIK